MMVGVASGTYSSIFIAAPVLTEWKEREPAYRSRRARIEEAMGRVPTFPEDNVVPQIDEVERHVAAESPGDGDGRPADGAAAEPEPAAAPVAVAEPPVERAAPPEPTPEETGEGVAGRPEAGRRADEADAEPQEAVAAPAQAREEPLDGSPRVGDDRASRSGTSPSSCPTAGGRGSSGRSSAPSIGAVITGAAAQIALGDSLGETGIETVLFAIPGVALGLAVIWAIGVRGEAERLAEPA